MKEALAINNQAKVTDNTFPEEIQQNRETSNNNQKAHEKKKVASDREIPKNSPTVERIRLHRCQSPKAESSHFWHH